MMVEYITRSQVVNTIGIYAIHCLLCWKSFWAFELKHVMLFECWYCCMNVPFSLKALVSYWARNTLCSPIPWLLYHWTCWWEFLCDLGAFISLWSQRRRRYELIQSETSKLINSFCKRLLPISVVLPDIFHILNEGFNCVSGGEFTISKEISIVIKSKNFLVCEGTSCCNCW
jgi:hypothetical protein